LRTAVPFLVVFLAVHPSTYRTAGLRRGTATSSSTRPGTTSAPVEDGDVVLGTHILEVKGSGRRCRGWSSPRSHMAW